MVQGGGGGVPDLALLVVSLLEETGEEAAEVGQGPDTGGSAAGLVERAADAELEVDSLAGTVEGTLEGETAGSLETEGNATDALLVEGTLAVRAREGGDDTLERAVAQLAEVRKAEVGAHLLGNVESRDCVLVVTLGNEAVGGRVHESLVADALRVKRVGAVRDSLDRAEDTLHGTAGKFGKAGR